MSVPGVEVGAISARQEVTAIVGERLPILREALVRMLARDFSLTVCHAGGDVVAALDQVVAVRPRLAVIDVDVGGDAAFDGVARAAQQSPRTRFVLTAVHFSSTGLGRAHAVGARACILKSDTRDEFYMAIRDSLAGRFTCSRRLRERFGVRWDRKSHRFSVDGPLSELTRREIHVLTYIGRGYSTKEIAVALKLSPKTVDRHKWNVMLKLDTHNRVLLSHHAIREGLVSVW